MTRARYHIINSKEKQNNNPLQPREEEKKNKTGKMSLNGAKIENVDLESSLGEQRKHSYEWL